MDTSFTSIASFTSNAQCLFQLEQWDEKWKSPDTFWYRPKKVMKSATGQPQVGLVIQERWACGPAQWRSLIRCCHNTYRAAVVVPSAGRPPLFQRRTGKILPGCVYLCYWSALPSTVFGHVVQVQKCTEITSERAQIARIPRLKIPRRMWKQWAKVSSHTRSDKSDNVEGQFRWNCLITDSIL